MGDDFFKLSDSHAFWAVVYDLVVAPLVKGHLATLAGKALTTIGIQLVVNKETKDLFSKSPNKVFVHGTKHWLTEGLKVIKRYIFFCFRSNLTVGLNLCPLTGKTFSTFFPLLLTSTSSSTSTHDETSRMRLPDGFIGCLN